MKKKIVLIILSLLILFTIYKVGVYDIKSGRYESYGKIVPNNIKNFLKRTIFIVPTLKKTLANKDEVIKSLSIEKIKTLEFWNALSKSDISKIAIKKIETKKIIIENKSYFLNKFLLPMPDYHMWGSKSVGYLDIFNNKIFFVTGDGTIFYFNDNVLKKNISKVNNFNILKINSNLSELVYENLLKPHKSSIKDILIKNNKIFISHINKKNDNCHNIEIIYANLNYEFINFENFFTYDECFVNGELHSSGGRIVSYSENELLFSIGEGLNRRLAQNKNSIFGKIIKIDINTLDYKIVSMGHRNPQGLFYDEINNVIMSTEHGPSGGDEINRIKFDDKISNYGWPISSYGNHYPGNIDKFKRRGKLNELLDEAPLHKSHTKYSFEEPLKFFTPSIGISEIIKIPNNSISKLKDYYLVGAMGNNIDEGDKSLHYFKLSNNYQIENYNKTVIGERIRDLIYHKESNLIILVLENSPSIGFLSYDN